MSRSRPLRLTSAWMAILCAGLLGGWARPLAACPFCAAVKLTFSEEIQGSDVAVLARLIKLPAESAGAEGKATFEVSEVLKGQSILGKTRRFETLYFGSQPVGMSCLVLATSEPSQLVWTTPIPISERGRSYLLAAIKLPKEASQRLVFFQDYLEDADEALALDAYDEFAKTPYAGIKELKPFLQHDKLVEWVQNLKIVPSRRRLYLTMLGVCGTAADLPLLEKMIRSEDRQAKSGLDALLAAYLTIKGPEGMQLVEDLFLKPKDADYIDTYSAIMAVRFQGQEEKIVPRERLVEGLRYMLDRPQLADQVIADLARWQDWDSMVRLVELFKNADEESIWVRVPVINFLRACPLPEAKRHLADLAEIDPDSVKKANSFFPFSGAPAAKDSKPAEATPANPASASPAAGGKSDDAKSSSVSPSGKNPQSIGPSTTPVPRTTSRADRRSLDDLPTDNAALNQVSLDDGMPIDRLPAAALENLPIDAAQDDQALTGVEPANRAAESVPAEDELAEAQQPGGRLPRGASGGAASRNAVAVGRPLRLSRSAAATAHNVPQIGALQVVGWMSLATGIVAVFMLAILRGGQQASSPIAPPLRRLL